MSVAWTSSNVALLQVSADAPPVAAGAGANRFVAGSGAGGTSATFAPAAQLDLRAYDELRFWMNASRPGDGSSSAPFYLEVSYADAADAVGETHRWYVPVNAANRWEQRRIGIENDRREAVTEFRFRCLTDLAFTCAIDEFLAVRDDMLADVENALVAELDGQIALAGLTGIPLRADAAAGASQLVLALSPSVRSGNRIVVADSVGKESHEAASVTHDPIALTTTVQFAPGDTLAHAFTSVASNVSVAVPVLVETPPVALPAVNPAIVLTRLDVREDLERSAFFTQRDSFRDRGGQTVVSVRRSPRAYFVEYQITALGSDSTQYLAVHALLLRQLSIDTGLRVNGVALPVQTATPTQLWNRELAVIAPVYVRLSTRLEIEARRELPLITGVAVDAAPIGAPASDGEGLVIKL